MSGSDTDCYSDGGSDNYSDGEIDGESDQEDFGAQLASLVSPKEDAKKPTSSASVTDQLEQLEQFFASEEKCGPELSAKLAKIINSSMRSKVSSSKIEEVADKHLRPKNADNLTVPKVNPEIWDRMTSTAQGRDLALQKLQANMTKAVITQAKLMEIIIKGMEDKSTIDPNLCWDLASDGFQLMAYTFSEMSQRRRDFIRPEVGGQYRRLCGSHNPVTNHLFGDELNKQIKEINEAARIGNKVSSSQRSRPNGGKFRHRPYNQSKRYNNGGQSYQTSQSNSYSGDFHRGRQARPRKKNPGGHNNNNGQNNFKRQ
jgi:hypothetical protein